MDAPTALAVARTDMVTVLQPGGLAFATIEQIQADPVGQIVALTGAVAALTARVAVLEGKPEEAAHFVAAAAVPAISILGGGSVTLTNPVPARAGDVLKAGEEIIVRPAVALPNGVGIAAARVTADGVVVVQLVTSVAISAGASIAWNITALR